MGPRRLRCRGFDALLDALLAGGLSSLDHFALVAHDDDATRLIVRGAPTATVSSTGGEEILSASPGATWAEQVLTGVTSVRVTLTGEGSADRPPHRRPGPRLGRRSSVRRPRPRPRSEAAGRRARRPSSFPTAASGAGPRAHPRGAAGARARPRPPEPTPEPRRPPSRPLRRCSSARPATTRRRPARPPSSRTSGPTVTARPRSARRRRLRAPAHPRPGDRARRVVSRPVASGWCSPPARWSTSTAPCWWAARRRRGRFASHDQPHVVTVPSPHQEISSTHLEIRPGAGADHGSAIATDLGSTNGTVLAQPGLDARGPQARHRRQPDPRRRPRPRRRRDHPGHQPLIERTPTDDRPCRSTHGATTYPIAQLERRFSAFVIDRLLAWTVIAGVGRGVPRCSSRRLGPWSARSPVAGGAPLAGWLRGRGRARGHLARQGGDRPARGAPRHRHPDRGRPGAAPVARPGRGGTADLRHRPGHPGLDRRRGPRPPAPRLARPPDRLGRGRRTPGPRRSARPVDGARGTSSTSPRCGSSRRRPVEPVRTPERAGAPCAASRCPPTSLDPRRPRRRPAPAQAPRPAPAQAAPPAQAPPQPAPARQPAPAQRGRRRRPSSRPRRPHRAPAPAPRPAPAPGTPMTSPAGASLRQRRKLRDRGPRAGRAPSRAALGRAGGPPGPAAPRPTCRSPRRTPSSAPHPTARSW